MVVVDSSVLIPLLRIGKINLLKFYYDKVLIPKEIYEEIVAGKTGFSIFEEACKDWIAVSSRLFSNAGEIAKKEGIALADAVLLLLAEEKKAPLISNDAALMLIARSRGIRCIWLTTFLLNCLKKKIITKKDAKSILLQLVEASMHLTNDVYSALLEIIDKY